MAYTKVTGALVGSLSDLDLTNVGDIQLDSISGDADTNTSITFSGSDVITIATGGSGRLTIGDGALSPVTDNQIDLGTSSLEFKDAFFDGTVTSDAFAGPLTGDVTGNVSGSAATVTTAAQTNITSLGTLTALTGGTGDLIWDTNTLVVDSSANKVGIGTTSPGDLLHITNGDNAVDTRIQLQAFGQLPIWHTKYAAGTQSSPTVATSGTELSRFAVSSWDGTDYSQSAAQIRIVAEANHADNSAPSYMAFDTNSTTRLATEKMRITAAGNVGIGDTSPDYRLVVKGAAATNDNIFKIEDSAGVKMASMEQDSSGNGRWIVCDTSGNADVLIHTDGNSYFNGGRLLLQHTTPIANASLDDLEVGSGSGNTGMTIYSGTSGYGGIAFADGNTGASDQYPGLIEFYHSDNSMRLYTANTERMRITSTGNVGLGEAVPHEKMHITGASGTALLMHMDADTADGTAALLFKLDSTNDDRRIKYGIIAQRGDPGTRGTGELHICLNGANSDTNVSVSDTKIAIGTNGVATGDFNDTSDLGFKENVADLGNTLEIIKQLKPRTFTWKGSKELRGDSVGFIAQEVKSVISDETIVQGTEWEKDGDTGLSVNTIGIVAYLTKAVQELETRVKELEG